ncbi:MAG: PorT family protein [Bacteroidales bacterium]|nr:MAG: PorT family protein [Bacteroidales bacterium]
MKKTIVFYLLFCLLAVSASVHAQKRVVIPDDRSASDQGFRKVQFGLGLGLNVASVVADWEDYFTDGDEVGSHTGINFGVYLKLRASKVFAFQPGLQYSSKGYTVGDDTSMDMFYFCIPLQFKFYLYDELNIELGPTIGILTSAKFTVGEQDPVDFIEEDGFIPIDINLGFGLGYQFKFGLAMVLHYDLGLFNTNSYYLDYWYDDYYYDRSDFPMKNRVFQINVLYFF